VKTGNEEKPMKALVYGGPGKREWKEVPKPGIKDPTDAIVRVTAVTICGTDLHILKGDVPEVEPGRVLGHEAVGVVEEVGASVTGLEPGDRVLISCITTCGGAVELRSGPPPARSARHPRRPRCPRASPSR
jgi:alcohol dehydrogenase